MNGRSRQFSRGGTMNPEPPRRRRFRGHQYVRRRTPPSASYRGGSFSDDRNDSSPPPTTNSNIRQGAVGQVDDVGSSFVQQQQQSHYQQPQRMQRTRNRYRDSRASTQDSRTLYDNHHQQRQSNQNTTSSGRNYDASDNEYNDDSHHHHHHHQQQHSRESDAVNSGAGTGAPVSNKKFDELTKSFHGQKTDIEEIKVMFSKLSTELDHVKSRVKELEISGAATSQIQLKEGGDEKEKRRQKFKLKQRERKAAKLAEKRVAISETTSSQQHLEQKILNSEQQNSNAVQSSKTKEGNQNADNEQVSTNPKYNNRTNRERNMDKRRVRREPKDKPAKPLPRVNKNIINDDSTTQAAEPSSEDRPEGDDRREGSGKERVKVLRRKKQHFKGRSQYGNRRRRADSSERNSNDTSPQGEANGNNDYHDERKKKLNKKTFHELSELELNELVQTMKREFINSTERTLKAIKITIDAKGPKVAYEFAVSILDHAICDVTSPTKLSEIANNLYQLIVDEDNLGDVDFQQGFYDALNDLSKREDDIAIDAPRYMDTLGQVLADCIIPMSNKNRHLIKKFLNKCLDSYCQKNRAILLVSIMKGIASSKDERFAKELWDIAELNWETLINEGTDLNEFVESHDVKFTTQTFAPEPRKPKRDSKELEKFADDVTSLVEKRCSPQTLNDLVKDLNLETEDQVDYYGTLIYAIVRGCLVTDSVNSYRLDNDTLNKYSSILNAKHDDQDSIALHALTALTKLWHSYTSPQNLLRTIFMELHNHGTASYAALNEWLNSASLTNIPGIGAARLSSKRYIEDLGANFKA